MQYKCDGCDTWGLGEGGEKRREEWASPAAAHTHTFYCSYLYFLLLILRLFTAHTHTFYCSYTYLTLLILILTLLIFVLSANHTHTFYCLCSHFRRLILILVILLFAHTHTYLPFIILILSTAHTHTSHTCQCFSYF